MNGPHVVLIRRGITVTVTDVQDPDLTRAIESAARQALRHLSGKWDVSLGRAHAGREWALRLRGASGQHVTTFAAEDDRLPGRVAEKLRGILEYLRAAERVEP